MKFNENLKRIRKERGMTQVQLAAAIGAGVHTVKMWESGKHKPNIGIINKMCDILEVSAAELCGLEAPKPDITLEIEPNKLLVIEEIMKMDDEKFKHLVKYMNFLKKETGNRG